MMLGEVTVIEITSLHHKARVDCSLCETHYYSYLHNLKTLTPQEAIESDLLDERWQKIKGLWYCENCNEGKERCNP